MPHAFLQQGVRAAQDPPAGPGRLRRRHGLPADRPAGAPPVRGAVREDRPRGGAAGPRLARPCRPTTPTSARPPAPPSRSSARSSSAGRAAARPPTCPTSWPSSASCTSSASASRTRSAARACRSAAMFYVPSLSCKTLIYKGMLNAAAGAALLPRPARPGRGVGPGAGPFALQHQHVPDLGPRPPLPLPGPQRRDQHAARQRQLDARPRKPVRAPTCSATTSRRSCRSSTRAAATRRCSTTPWSCWCCRAGRCRTRS